MNADRLLSHFEKISDAPNAVDRLRRFMLDLAVRGKLVEQDPGDGTATDLLAQHQLVVEASGEMQPFPLPDSWAWVPVGVVCSKTGSGSTPRGGKTAYVSKGIPFLRSQNVHDDGLTLDDVAYIDGATHGKMIGTAVQPDDLLLNITGGSMGRCCHVPSSFKEGNVSQHVAILRVAIPGTQAFLHKCIISPFFQSLIFDEQTGAGRGGLPKNRMDRLPVPLPPLAEQHRIVSKVDELMQLCDRLEASQKERESRRDRLVVASLKRLSQPTDPNEFKKDARYQLSNLNRLSTKPEHIKELRKAILNLAVRGKLVPQDEREGTAAEVLAANPDKPRGRQSKSPATRQLENAREPCFVLPPSWAWTTVGGVVQAMRYGTSKKCNRDPRGVPVLRIPNVSKGAIDCSDLKYGPLTASEVQDLGLEQGDLLIIRSNGSLDIVGRAALITPEAAGMCYAGYLVRLRPNAGVLDPRYMWYTLKAPYVRQHIEGPIRTTVGLKNINSKEIARLPIPLPPLAEQKRIVAKVDELMLICDQWENQLECQQKGRRQLVEALLHEALEGVE